MRMCMGCRTRRRKDELLRFIRKANGGFVRAYRKEIDGRGFYLCPDLQCLKKAGKKNRTESFVEFEIFSSDQKSLTR